MNVNYNASRSKNNVMTVQLKFCVYYILNWKHIAHGVLKGKKFRNSKKKLIIVSHLYFKSVLNFNITCNPVMFVCSFSELKFPNDVLKVLVWYTPSIPTTRKWSDYEYILMCMIFVWKHLPERNVCGEISLPVPVPDTCNFH